ncbi:histone-lysine N-methyltransferase PRDM7-like isoform 2-T5 [Glossophaga mutica]
MGDGEKGLYPIVKRTLDVLASPGLRAPRPAFLCHHRRLQEEDPEDSDEEGAPRQHGRQVWPVRRVLTRGCMMAARRQTTGNSINHVKPSWVAFRREQRRHRKATSRVPLSNEYTWKELSGTANLMTARDSEHAQKPVSPSWRNNAFGKHTRRKSELRRQEMDVKMYSLRERKDRVYQEVSESQDDDYLYRQRDKLL